MMLKCNLTANGDGTVIRTSEFNYITVYIYAIRVDMKYCF